LERSRARPRIDDRPVWSIVCFFVTKKWRRQGLMVPLLQGAVSYALDQGADIIEGYPLDPPAGVKVQGGVEGYVGLASAFRKAGFVEVLRPGEQTGGGPDTRRGASRVIMRYYRAGVSVE
jgi:GNAT superfamily N-acetyltransferase